MARRSEVVLAGSGGQGVLLSGILLAEAAIREGRNVVQTVSYGIATRGGQSATEVIVDDDEIVFQQVETPDVVLAMSPEAMRQHEGRAGEGALVVYDATLVDEREGANLVGFPFTGEASRIGNAGLANLIALGFLARASGIVSAGALEAAIAARFSGAVAAADLAALRRGIEAATARWPERV
jgi:2-oxoglutarate ferredoxin oxidoreductase subunit gamma